MESADSDRLAVVVAAPVPLVRGALRHAPALPARPCLRAARGETGDVSGDVGGACERRRGVVRRGVGAAWD
jgi:hypothetical protein